MVPSDYRRLHIQVFQFYSEHADMSYNKCHSVRTEKDLLLILARQVCYNLWFRCKFQHILFQLCSKDFALRPVYICLSVFIDKRHGINTMNIFNWFWLRDIMVRLDYLQLQHQSPKPLPEAGFDICREIEIILSVSFNTIRSPHAE